MSKGWSRDGEQQKCAKPSFAMTCSRRNDRADCGVRFDESLHWIVPSCSGVIALDSCDSSFGRLHIGEAVIGRAHPWFRCSERQQVASTSYSRHWGLCTALRAGTRKPRFSSEPRSDGASRLRMRWAPNEPLRRAQRGHEVGRGGFSRSQSLAMALTPEGWLMRSPGF